MSRHWLSLPVIVLMLTTGCTRPQVTPTAPPSTATWTPAPTQPPTGTPIPSPLPPTLTPTPTRRALYSGLIVYVQATGRSMDIYTAKSDGTARTQVARGQPVSNLPTWLPDGRRVAYVVAQDIHAADLWLVEAIGAGEPRPVTRDGKWEVQYLSWSPGGEFAVFDDDEPNDQGSDVYCVDMSTGQVMNLTPGSTAWDAQPAWSPDGQWIAFFSNRGLDKITDIWHMRPDGTELRNLTNNGKVWEDIVPAWSPDGRQIAFFRYARGTPSAQGGPSGLWVMDADGANQRLVVELEGKPCFEPPVWSPDGRRIAYTHAAEQGQNADCQQGETDVWVADMGGGQPVNVSPMPGGATGISWSPDSQALTFTNQADDTYTQYVAAADGSDTYRLVEEEDASFGRWQPAARQPATGVAWRGCAAPQVATPTPRATARTYPGLIAYSGPPGNTVDIYTMKPDGTQRTRLTRGEGLAFAPSWSPDGRFIAYQNYDLATKKTDLWVIDLGAGNRARLVIKGGEMVINTFSWSPDGSAVVFGRYQPSNNQSDVYRLDIVTGQATNLTADYPLWDAFPVWSPDGRWIAFVSNRVEGGRALDDICLMRPDGSGFKKLTDNGFTWEDEYPAWSPDSRQIAFLRYNLAADFLGQPDPPGGPAGLWVMNADGSNQRLVVKLEAHKIMDTLLWSPDGKLIAFLMPTEGSEGTDVWVVPAVGGEAVNVSQMPGAENVVSWSPDSRALTFTNLKDNTYTQWIVAADGSDQHVILAPGEGALGQWSPQ